MISVEIGMLNSEKPSETVTIYFDKAGLALLLEKLTSLNQDETDHFDLFTDSWGDGELEQLENIDGLICHHLKIMKLTST